LEFNAFRAPALTHLTENCCLSVFLIKATGHRVMNVLLSQEYSDGTKYSQVTLREKCYVLIKACTEAEKKLGNQNLTGELDILLLYIWNTYFSVTLCLSQEAHGCNIVRQLIIYNLS